MIPYKLSHKYFESYKCSIYTIDKLLNFFEITEQFRINIIKNIEFIDSVGDSSFFNVSNFLSESSKFIDTNGLSNISLSSNTYGVAKNKIVSIIKPFTDNEYQFLDDGNNWFYKRNKLKRNRLYNTIYKLFSFSAKYKISDFYSAITKQNRIKGNRFIFFDSNIFCKD